MNIKPCMEHGSSFYVNIEEKVWLLVKKIRTWKDWRRGRLKLCFLTEIGRLHWNQDEEVAHFAWFGEPWCVLWVLNCLFLLFSNRHACFWKYSDSLVFFVFNSMTIFFTSSLFFFTSIKRIINTKQLFYLPVFYQWEVYNKHQLVSFYYHHKYF